MAQREEVFTLWRSRTAVASPGARSRISALGVVFNQFRTPFIALLVAFGYYAGSQIGFLLTPVERPIAAFWPPNAILLAALLLTPRRIWWVLILAVLPAHLLVQLRAGIPLVSALAWFIGNSGEALLGAVSVRSFKRNKPLFESVPGVIVFLIFGVLLPTFATSFLDAAGVVLTGLAKNYWIMWTTRLTSNIVADLTVVPAVIVLSISGVSWLRRANTSAYWEAGALGVSTVIVSSVVFGGETAFNNLWALIYALLPLLIWALLRFGSAGASLTLLTITLISAWNTMHGRGPLGMQSAAYGVLSLHFLLTVLAVSFMLCGALIAEKSQGEEALRVKCGNLVHAQEQERYRIARELHDNIVQRLTLVSLYLDEIRTVSLTLAKTPLNNLYDQISDISNRIRDLSHDLHPFMLEYLGLPRALGKLCRDVHTQRGITIEFSERGKSALLPSPISYCLFRVAQEVLQDMAQHSQAKTAVVELRTSDQVAVLRISDDGVGSDPSKPERMGLTYVREQVLVLDGTLEMAFIPATGTVIEVSLPVGSHSGADLS